MDSSPAWTRYEEGDGEEAKISGKGKSADAKTSKNFQRFPSVRQRLYTTRALWSSRHFALVICVQLISCL